MFHLQCAGSSRLEMRPGGALLTPIVNVVSRSADKIVHTKIIPSHDEPSNVSYRMRESGGIWKIIDATYDGSANRRSSDQTSPLWSPPAGLSDNLMKP
jgi:hypothetical protein